MRTVRSNTSRGPDSETLLARPSTALLDEVLVANVWQDFQLVSLAGALMTAVTGPPASPPPVNPQGPPGARAEEWQSGCPAMTSAAFICEARNSGQDPCRIVVCHQRLVHTDSHRLLASSSRKILRKHVQREI